VGPLQAILVWVSRPPPILHRLPLLRRFTLRALGTPLTSTPTIKGSDERSHLFTG
jgi:hypothetical protein